MTLVMITNRLNLNYKSKKDIKETNHILNNNQLIGLTNIQNINSVILTMNQKSLVMIIQTPVILISCLLKISVLEGITLLVFKTLMSFRSFAYAFLTI
jgi:hypothetical protein